MPCTRTQHRNNVTGLRVEKHDFSLKIVHQAGFETARQAATSVTQQAQNIYITFIQRRPNVFDVGPTLHKWYTNVLFAGKAPGSNHCAMSLSKNPLYFNILVDVPCSLVRDDDGFIQLVSGAGQRGVFVHAG